MTIPAFAVTYDYRCPWARNMHEHIVTGLRGGADWDVTFLPFSLNQAHVEEGGTPVWDNAEAGPALLAGLVTLTKPSSPLATTSNSTPATPR
jgi:hypothetical protein